MDCFYTQSAVKGAPLLNKFFNSTTSPSAAAFNNCLPNSLMETCGVVNRPPKSI